MNWVFRNVRNRLSARVALAAWLLVLVDSTCFAQLPSGGEFRRVAAAMVFDVDPPELGEIVFATSDNPDLAQILGADDDGYLRLARESVRVLPRGVGQLSITLGDATGASATVLVQIVPTSQFIQTELQRQFPFANLEVTVVSDKVLIVNGALESAEEIESIMSLAQALFGKDTTAINGLRVVGVNQVQLEVMFARVDRAQLRKLGFNTLKSETPWYAGTQIGSLIEPPRVSVRGGGATGGANVFPTVGGNAAATLSPQAQIFFGVTDQLKAFYGYVEFLQSNGAVEVLATPTIVTMTGRPAEFLVGGEQPIPIVVGANATPSVEFKKFGTRLDFLPTVLGQGKIRLDLIPEVSTVNLDRTVTVGTISVPQFVVQRLHATVELESGQSLIMGGLMQKEIGAQVEQIPYLGALPVIGPAFRRIRHEERDTELLVVVTPRLVGALEQHQRPDCVPGQETRSPTNKELWWHGLIEVPTAEGHCDRDYFPEERHPSPYGSELEYQRQESLPIPEATSWSARIGDKLWPFGRQPRPRQAVAPVGYEAPLPFDK